jgi:uncharacterized RDD family membrane protein YckC
MTIAVDRNAPSAQGRRGPTAGDPSAARSLHFSTVVTPEGVVLDFRAAGVGSRMLARGIDVILQGIAVLVSAFMALILGLTAGEAVGIASIVVLLFLVIYGYPALLETWWNGQTVGKRLLRIRVITVEGGPVGLRHSGIRALLETFDLWLPAPGGLVALTSALLTKRSQRLGDLAAGTIVIRVPKASPTPMYFAPAFGTHAYTSTLDTSQLAPQQYALVRELILRAGELLPEPRQQLAEALATNVAEVVGSPRAPGVDAQSYLASVLHAHQQRWVGGAATGNGRQPAPPMPPPPVAARRPVPTGVDLGSLPPPTGPPAWPGR